MLDIYPGKLNKRPYFVLKALVRLNYGIYSTCLTLTSTKLQWKLECLPWCNQYSKQFAQFYFSLGWGAAEVRLCHASCFWSGSSNLLDTLIEIRKFLENNRREVITIIFEDYLKNPTILKRVFDQARISLYVLLKDNYGDRFHDWPTLRDMRRLGRLVVFNNNGLSGFPYTESNMWRYVRENRYGSPGQNVKVE